MSFLLLKKGKNKSWKFKILNRIVLGTKIQHKYIHGLIKKHIGTKLKFTMALGGKIIYPLNKTKTE